jgi:hypothetical protein
MMPRFNRQDLVKRAQALMERRRPVVQQQTHWWSDAAQRELQAFRDGGPLPTSAEALQLLEVDIELEERV